MTTYDDCDCVPGHKCDCWEYRPSVEPLDVERLARALEASFPSRDDMGPDANADARLLAAEYDRLLPTQASDSPEKP